MALIPNLYQQTGQSFNETVSQITSFAQQMKRNQQIKLQQAQQVAQQKEMTQFRADVQLQKQKGYYEEVTQPQQQQQRQYEQLQNLQERINQSAEDAKKKISQHSEELYNKQHSAIHDYNIMDARFGTEQNEDGTVNESIYINVGDQSDPESYQQVDEQTYRDMLTQATNFANFLDNIKQSEQNGELAELEEGQFATQEERRGEQVSVYRIGENNAKSYLQRIRQDPEFRQQQMQLRQNEQLQIATSDTLPERDEEGGGQADTPQSPLYPAVGKFKAAINEEPEQKYGRAEDSFFPWGGAELKESRVNYNADVSSVQKQVRDALNKVYDVDTTQITPEATRAIIQGNTTDLSGDLADYAQQTQEDDGLKQLFTALDFYTNAYDEWSSKSAQSYRPDEVKLNFKFQEGDIGDIFQPIDMNDPAAKAQRNANALWNKHMGN